MTLVPALVLLDRYAVPEWHLSALPESDPVVRALLYLKRNPESRAAFEALRQHQFIDAELICTAAARTPQGHVEIDYAVEAYLQGFDALESVLAPSVRLFGRTIRPQVPESIRLYRVTDSRGENPGAGVWWAGSAWDARREGSGRSESPGLFTALVPASAIVARTRTRFGAGGISPSEFVADPTGLSIKRIS